MLDQEEPSKEVISLLRDGQKIKAIKLIRQQNDMGLKEAKELVENYILKHPERFPNPPEASSSPRYLIWVCVAIAVLLIFQFTG